MRLIIRICTLNLFCSMVTYEYIRKNKPDCFKLMVKEVDTCWRPTEVGSLAATLVDRIDKIDSDPATHPLAKIIIKL